MVETAAALSGSSRKLPSSYDDGERNENPLGDAVPTIVEADFLADDCEISMDACQEPDVTQFRMDTATPPPNIEANNE